MIQNRFKVADKALEKKQKQLEKTLIKEYSRALKDIRSLLAEYYAKYEMTYAEMQKYKRLAGLEKTLIEELRKLTKKNSRTLIKGLGDQFAESYYRTAFILETEVQAKLAYTLLNPKVIEASIMNPISGLKLNERLNKNRDLLITKIRENITQGLIKGESYRDMAKRVKNVLEGDAAKAIRVVNTESHRAQNDGRLKSMEHAASKGVIMKKRWIATLDDRTRDLHQELDGQEIDIDENFTSPSGASGPAPGQLGSPEDDINCRCTMISVIKGFEPEVRRARGEGIIPYQNYKEWYNNRIKR